jgi:hypothetical protein
LNSWKTSSKPIRHTLSGYDKRALQKRIDELVDKRNWKQVTEIKPVQGDRFLSFKCIMESPGKAVENGK